MEWFALIIPFLFSFVGLQFFGRELNKAEIVAPIVISLLFIGIFKVAANSYNVSDTEYWGSKLIRAEYYEKWDEWIEETCETCTTDEDGNQDCVEWDCSYRRYHDAYWQLIDEYGRSFGVSQREYLRLVKKFGNETFKDMHRDYDLTDGDMYFTKWDRIYENLENITSTKTYVNKPQATRNLFHYGELDKADKKGLFEYPLVRSHKQQHLLGINNPELSLELERMNALLAREKQIKLFLIVYPNQPRDISFKQEALWKGGNKNEFIVTIGTSGGEITWSRVISWTENQYSKIYAEELFMENKSMDDLLQTTKKLAPILKEHFERKEFSDFDYIKVPLTKSQLTWLYVVTILVNIGIIIFTVRNDIR